MGWLRSSRGHRAFVSLPYRDNALRRLEEEQTAFKSFREQLRRAKDRAEFDQFMTQRKSG
jgi:hypothetical protein